MGTRPFPPTVDQVAIAISHGDHDAVVGSEVTIEMGRDTLTAGELLDRLSTQPDPQEVIHRDDALLRRVQRSFVD